MDLLQKWIGAHAYDRCQFLLFHGAADSTLEVRFEVLIARLCGVTPCAVL